MAKTITPTLSATSVTMTVNLTYKLKSQTSYIATYDITTNTSNATKTITVDLSDIPANSKITSAILTWTSSVVNSNFSGTTSTGFGTVRCESGSSVATNENTANFTNDIVPGQVNTFTFKYSPTVNTTVSTETPKTSLSGNTKLTCSDIELSITYEPSATLTYYTSATAKKSCTVHYYTGSAWKDCEVYYWNGNDWVQCGV